MFHIANKKSFYYPLFIVLACVAAYSNSIHQEFFLDDDRFLLSSKNVSSVSWMDMLTKGYLGFYRPFAMAFLRLELNIFGSSAAGYHVVNILLFLSICLLFFFILKGLLKNEEIAFLAVLLFAVHPINHALLNFKNCSMIMVYVLCMQLSALFFIKYIDGKKSACLYWSLAFYLLSLFSHEVSFLLPLYLFLVLFYFKDFRWKEAIRYGFLYLLAFLFFLIIRTHVPDGQKINGLLNGWISFSQYMDTFAKLIGWYVQKLFLPKDILFLWDVKVVNGPQWGWVFFLIVYAVGMVGAILNRKRNILAFGLCLFLAGFIPVLFSSVTYTALMPTMMIEPHWLVFSSIGFFLILAYGLIKLKSFFMRPLWVLLVLALTVGCIFQAREYNELFRDAETYCTYHVRVNPINASIWQCWAHAYVRNNDKGLDQSKYLDCDEVSFLAWAYYLSDKDHPDTAIKYYTMALSMDPACASAQYGLVNLHTALGTKPASLDY